MVMTYDARERVYRRWLFYSRGDFGEHVGRWDEAAKTMTWTGDLPNGGRLTSVTRWVDDDRREWSVVRKDAAGKVVYEMHVTSTRRT